MASFKNQSGTLTGSRTPRDGLRRASPPAPDAIRAGPSQGPAPPAMGSGGQARLHPTRSERDPQRVSRPNRDGDPRRVPKPPRDGLRRASPPAPDADRDGPRVRSARTRRGYFFSAGLSALPPPSGSAMTVPPLALQAFSLMSTIPLPLQPFWPLQALSALLHPPLPLQAFTP